MSRPETIAQRQADARIPGRCPTCEEDCPPGRALLFYADAPLPGAARKWLEARRANLQARAMALRERRRSAREGARQKRINVNVGKILEGVVPVCNDFGSVPRDCRPLFDPIDYVVFNGRETEPLSACRGYFAHDVKPLFDPIDYIVFDGINASPAVGRILLFDGPARSHAGSASNARSSAPSRQAITSRRQVRMGKDGPDSAGGRAVTRSGADRRKQNGLRRAGEGPAGRPSGTLTDKLTLKLTVTPQGLFTHRTSCSLRQAGTW